MVESRNFQVQRTTNAQNRRANIQILIEANQALTPPKGTVELHFGLQPPRSTLSVAGDHGQKPSLRFAPWFAKLTTFASLADGWDSYKAPKPGPIAIANAARYLHLLDAMAWDPHRVAPSVMGGVGITHRRGSRKVYVEFYNTGKIHSLFSDRSTKEMDTMSVDVGLPAGYHFIRKAQEYLDG